MRAFLLSAFLAAGAAAFAQPLPAGQRLQPDAPATAQTAPSAKASHEEAASEGPADYRVGPGDLLIIQVFGVKEFDQGVRISNSGKIHVNYLGILQVAGKTIAQLEAELAEKLREKGLVRDPWVQVKVSEYRAYPVYILGEVMTPGQFVLKTEMTLRDLVVLGQGFNSNASPVGFLYRLKPLGAKPTAEAQAGGEPEPGDASAASEVVRIDFRDLENNPEANLRLRPGDVLYCPERRKTYYFVVGEVLMPGLYEMPDPQFDAENNVAGSTILRLTQALAKAGGPARTAKLSKALVVRYGPNMEREEIPVDFEAVLKGGQPDIEVRLNDIIFVPGSTIKTLGYGLLGALPSILPGQVATAVR
jgi:protein involved in polysaccharide export with SLBB domain